MKLFHFTSAHHISGVLRDGIALGVIPILRDCGDGQCQLHGARRGCQWLTSNPSWEQAWATQEKVKYDRCAFRIRVSIPKSARSHLIPWAEAAVKLDVGVDSVTILNSTGNPAEWWIYSGVIPTTWLRNVDRKPVPKPQERRIIIP
jgi:hypothetical protein